MNSDELLRARVVQTDGPTVTTETSGPVVYIQTNGLQGPAGADGAGTVAENVETFDPSGAAVTLSAATTATVHLVVLSANCTVTVPSPALGHSHYVRVAQDATGGRALTWAGDVNWPDDQVPDQAQGADEYDVYVFTCDDPAFGWVGRQGGAAGVGPVDAADVDFTPTGAISSTDVQAAIAELDALLDGWTTFVAGTYAPKASAALTGNPTAPTQAAGNNSTRLATTAFVMNQLALAVAGLLEFINDLNASANPNYPAALKGDSYVITVAGKVGGASGKPVDVGDLLIAKADNAGGTEAAVGTSWFVLEHNLAGALLSANNLSDLASAATARTNLGLGSVDNTSDATKNAAAVTLTNKRIVERSTAPAFSATPAINTDAVDCVELAGLSGDITSLTTNLSGTPTNFQILVIRFEDNGSARTIAHGASFVAGSAALPTTTVAGKWKQVHYQYSTTSSKWESMSVLDEI